MSKSSKNFKSIGAYAVDLCIIIFGITISFFLNEWREGIQQKKVETITLQNILNNLEKDTIDLSRNIDQLGKMIERLEPLLKEEITSSWAQENLVISLDAFISYSSFLKTDVGYLEMTSTGNSGNITDRDLLNKIIGYYTQSNQILEEWNDIDRNFVLGTTIPYFQKEIPYSPYEKYGEAYAKNPALFNQKLQDGHFKSLVRDSILFKRASKFFYERNKKTATELIAEIQQYLK